MIARAAGVVLCVLAGPGSPAQIVTATASAGSMPVTCNVGPANSIPLGTDLTNGGTVSTQGSGSIGTAQATTTFQPLTIAPYEVDATFLTDISGAGTMAFSTLTAACGVFWSLPFVGRNDVLLRLHATHAVRGRFVITHTIARRERADLTYWVDVGDNGSLEASNVHPTQPLTPIAFGPGTFDVRMSNFAGSHLYDELPIFAGRAVLGVRFVPDSRCDAVLIAPACGTPNLQPQQNWTLGIDQRVDGLLPASQGVAILVYGWQPATTPLPMPPGCTLGNDAFAWRLLSPDALGHATHSVATVPLTLRPLSLFAQVVELDLARATLATSQGFRIDCH